MAKILLIDNSERILSPSVQNLKNSGMEVYECPCIASAVELARYESPDLVIAAQRLQGLNVLDLLELRKAEQSLHSVATLIVAQSPTHKLECFKLGCDDFVVSPLDDAELFFRICALLRRKSGNGMRGNFTDVGILDIVQMLMAARKDGVLSVEANGKSGALYFFEGHVVHANFDSFLGEEAFLALLRASHKYGTFVFLQESTAQIKKTIDKRTDHLLLGFANQLDEE